MNYHEASPRGVEVLSRRYEDIEYDNVLEETRPLAYESEIAQTEWGKAGLWYAIAQAKILRPRLRGPTTLRQSGALEKTGGPKYNPTREIDTVGGKVIRLIMGRINVPALVYIEEEKRWLKFNSEIPGVSVSIAVDPLDETGPMRIGLRVQTTAATIANYGGEFVAGTITSLVDDEMILIENEDVHLIRFYESLKNPDGGSPLVQLEIGSPEVRDIGDARIATLPRRMQELQRRFPIFANREYLPTFGGHGLLAMIRGDIDVMLDPLKGQPWYEAVHWGPMAERVGFSVSDPEGERIDFQNILLNAIQGKELGRVKIVISTHQELHNQVLQSL